MSSPLVLRVLQGSLYNTPAAHHAVLAELSSLLDDSKARYTAKTPTTPSDLNTPYNAQQPCFTFFTVTSKDPLSMLPTGHGDSPDFTGGCCGAAPVAEGCTLGAGAMARVTSLI